MNEHTIAILQWAGPALLAIFGAIVCYGLRAAFHTLQAILERNQEEHRSITLTLGAHERKMAEAEAVCASRARKVDDMMRREERRDGVINAHGERLSAVETRVEHAENDIHELNARLLQ